MDQASRKSSAIFMSFLCQYERPIRMQTNQECKQTCKSSIGISSALGFYSKNWTAFKGDSEVCKRTDVWRLLRYKRRAVNENQFLQPGG